MMMHTQIKSTGIRAAFFDMDGVLLDSLEAHLAICRDKSREFDLPLRMPTAREFRKLVRRGAVISPMEAFFRAVGFPSELAVRADEDYRKDFATHYPIYPFPGVRNTLRRLAATGMPLGVVTANTSRIVEAALGDAIEIFHPHCRFTVDDGRNLSKAQALIAGAAELQIPVSDTIYVGDQPKDYEAAAAAGLRFLGVTYGWGITGDDTRFPTAASLEQMESYLMAAFHRVRSAAA